MKREKRTKQTAGWYSESELCAIFGWAAANSFRQTWRDKLPPEAVRIGGPGKANQYHAATLHKLIVTTVEERERGKRRAADVDPLLGGPSSPALERYRERRAELAEIEVLERRRQLIPAESALAAFATIFDELALAVRRTLQGLSPAGATVWRDALTKARERAEQRFANGMKPTAGLADKQPETAEGSSDETAGRNESD